MTYAIKPGKIVQMEIKTNEIWALNEGGRIWVKERGQDWKDVTDTF